MYSGKHQRPVQKRKTGKQPGILLVSLVLLFAVIVGGSMAYLQDATNKVVNTFTPAQVTIDPSESVDHEENTKSDIRFQNTGNVPVFIRATLVIYWTDTIDGESRIIAKPEGADVVVGAVLNQNGWIQEGDIYYHTALVEPGEWTGVMLNPITVKVPEGSTAQCHIDVRAEAIQADGLGEHVTTAQEAWNAAKPVPGVG